MDVIGIALLVVFFLAFILTMFRLGARRARTCELCKKPREPNSKVLGTWKYGVLACDECGRQLEEKYKDDRSYAEPPPWARP